MPRVECPKCTAILEVEELGVSTECPECGDVFRPLGDQERQPSERSRITAFLGNQFEPEHAFERAAVTAEALRLVRRPAMGLTGMGLFGIAASVLLGLWGMAVQYRQMLRGWGDTGEVYNAFGIMIASAFYFSLVAAGGYKLRWLETRGFGIFAAFLAIFTAAFCGIWSIVSIPFVIYGTWTFAALHNPVVKHAMRWKRQERNDRN